jgi:hypothetical protein
MARYARPLSHEAVRGCGALKCRPPCAGWPYWEQPRPWPERRLSDGCDAVGRSERRVLHTKGASARAGVQPLGAKSVERSCGLGDGRPALVARGCSARTRHTDSRSVSCSGIAEQREGSVQRGPAGAAGQQPTNDPPERPLARPEYRGAAGTAPGAKRQPSPHRRPHSRSAEPQSALISAQGLC